MGLRKQAAAGIAAAMIACVSGAASAQQAAPTATEGETYAVLEYLFEFAHVRQEIDAKFAAMSDGYPDYAALVEGLRFDMPPLLHAMAKQAAPQFAADEMAACTAFVASKRGDQLLAMSRAEATLEAVIPKLEVLPDDQAIEIAAFMVAPCAQKMLAYMGSDAAATLAGEAALQQTCTHLMTKATPVQKQRLLDSGKCKG